MYEKGIVYVRDFYDEQNNLLSIGSIYRIFSIQNVPFTRVQGIVDSIPISWKRDDYPSDKDPQTLFQSFCKAPLVSRHVYKSLIADICTTPTAVRKWEGEFNLTPDQWKQIFKIPFNTLRSTKIQYFQFRFLHRVLATNHLLFLMNKRENNLCTFCNIADESITHLFWGCTVTSTFLLDIEQIILGQQFIFTKEDLFFGFKFYLLHPYNFLILHIKYYIFSQKVKEVPNVNEFLHKFKFVLQVEKSLSEKTTKHYVQFDQLKKTFNS